MDLNRLLPNGRRATNEDINIRAQKIKEQQNIERKMQNVEKEIKENIAKKEHEKLKTELKTELKEELTEAMLTNIKLNIERAKKEIIGAGEAKKAETK